MSTVSELWDVRLAPKKLLRDILLSLFLSIHYLTSVSTTYTQAQLCFLKQQLPSAKCQELDNQIRSLSTIWHSAL